MLLSKEQFDCAGHVKQKELFEYTPIQKDSILITEITTSNVIDYNSDAPSKGFLRFAFGGTYYQKFYSNLLTEKQTIITMTTETQLSIKINTNIILSTNR